MRSNRSIDGNMALVAACAAIVIPIPMLVLAYQLSGDLRSQPKLSPAANPAAKMIEQFSNPMPAAITRLTPK